MPGSDHDPELAAVQERLEAVFKAWLVPAAAPTKYNVGKQLGGEERL